MRILTKLWYVYFPQIDILFMLLFNRILFATLALSVLICVIMLARKKLAPTMRSWLWALCIPALFIPFEHGVVAIARSFYNPNFMPGILFHAANMSYDILHYIWLAGLAVFAVKTRKKNSKTVRLLKSGQLNVCAACFYEGRSHIYLPPDFEEAYSSSERQMLLAHETQHIMQHDPLLYRFLQVLQCVFWFNPLIYITVRCIRHDRELLCDERVVRGCSGREYGMLLLRETQKAPVGQMIPGIVSEAGGVYERVAACVKPFSWNKKPAFIVAAIASAMFIIGLIGFAKPIVTERMDINVSVMQDNGRQCIEGAERFVLLERDGMALDQKGLLEYAVSIGLKPEQILEVSIVEAARMSLTGDYTVSGSVWFTVSELEMEDIFLQYYDKGYYKPWGVLFKLL